MPNVATIEEFLGQKHLAFVGVSRDPKQFANSVYRKLREGGRTMYPVNLLAQGEPIEGDVSYRTLDDLPDPVDGVVVMVPVEDMTAVVEAAIARGIPRVWLHRGAGGKAVPDAAVNECIDNNVAVVDGACPLMFEGTVTGVHHLHKWLAHRRFAA